MDDSRLYYFAEGYSGGQLRESLRVEHYSYRTEQTYGSWIRRFVLFHHWQRPSSLGADHVHAFLHHLAMEKQVASSTQNQALNAVVFLYRKVIKVELFAGLLVKINQYCQFIRALSIEKRIVTLMDFST